MHEPYSINMDLSGLTNDELSHQLHSLGVNPGPIVGSTRRLYERKLASLLSAGRPDGPAAMSPDQRRTAADGPMTSEGGGAVRRRLGGDADGGENNVTGLDPNSPALRPVFLRDETDQPSPRRAVSDLRETSVHARHANAAQLSSSRSGAAGEPEYDEELRPWVRQFIKLCIILALVAAGYYVYQNGSDWPAVRYIQEAARAAPAPARPPLVAPPAAGVNN